MKNKVFFPAVLAFLAAVLFAGTVSASENTVRTITLEECLALAEAGHPSLEEARASLAAQ